MARTTRSTKEKDIREKKEVDTVTPRKFSEIENVVKKINRKEAVIVDFEEITPRVAQRMLDFLSGAIFVLNGTIKKVKNKTYVLIPDGIKVSTVREK